MQPYSYYCSLEIANTKNLTMKDMKKLLFLIICLTTLSLSAQTNQDENVKLNYPEIIEGKDISDSTLSILKTLDQASDKTINWYYERYTYLKRTSPSTDVEVILKYATIVRKNNLTNKN